MAKPKAKVKSTSKVSGRSATRAAKADRTQTAAITSDPCPLLDNLPAELRNRIYEYALIEAKEVIEMHQKTFEQSGILMTCRQIRFEASSIYYHNHVFQFRINDFDVSNVSAFCRRGTKLWWQRGNATSIRFSVHHAARSWTKLLEWCKSYYLCEVPRLNCTGRLQGKPCRFGAMTAAFNLVDEGTRLDLEWEQIVPLLSAVKLATSAEHRGSNHGWTEVRKRQG